MIQRQTRRRAATAAFLGVLIVLAGLGACEQKAQQSGQTPAADFGKRFKWKIQSLWQAGSISQDVFVRWTEQVKAVTGGRLEIEPLPVGTVVAYNETVDAVGSGILDGVHGGGGYSAGKEVGFALITDLNAAYETPYQFQMWYEYEGGKELAQELYNDFNMYFIGPVFWGAESIPAKRPIRSIEDFRGVKLRSPEGMAQEIFRKIGAAPVNIPGSEVYTALDRGVIEATDWGTLGMNEDLGYHKIAPYPIYPGIHSMPGTDVAVNLDRWNELPPDIQAILEVTVRDFARDMIQTMEMVDRRVAAEAAGKGVTLVNWTPEARKELREVAATVWKEYSARSEMGKKIYESQIAFLKKLGLID